MIRTLDDELIRRQRRAVRNMPPVTTCDNCGLTYYQTAAPHVCAGWTRGAKENVEVSKICNDHPWEKCSKCGVGICQEHMIAFLNHEPHYAKHEPVARGGEGERVILNSDLVVRPLPNTTKFLLITEDDWPVAEFYREEEAEGIAYEHNTHHSLLAEREKHTRLLEAAKLLLAMNNCNYDRDQMRRSGGFDTLNEAVEAIEPEWAKKLRGNDQKGE